MCTADHVLIRQMAWISSSADDPTPSPDEDLQYGSVQGGNVTINSKMTIKRQTIKEPTMQMITDLIYHISDSSKEFSFLYCQY